LTIKRYNTLPALRNGYALEDLSLIVDGTAYPLSSFGFFALGFDGLGVAPVSQRVDEFTLRRGGQYEGYRVPSRVLTIAGRFLNDDIFRVDREMTRLARLIVGRQVLLRSTEQGRQIAVRYVDGLTGSQEYRNGVDVVLRFVSDWPFWQTLETTTQELVTSFPETTFVVNRGTAPGYPIIIFTSSAPLRSVASIANTTTGGLVSFDIGSRPVMSSGDTVTIDLSEPTTPQVFKTIAGIDTDLVGELSVSSAISRMLLLPGRNTIITDVSFSVSANITYTEQYWGVEG
jgi:hypothetical protein